MYLKTYVESITDGEFNVIKTSSRIERNYEITEQRTYFYGGVDFTNIPVKILAYDKLLTEVPKINELITAAILNTTEFNTAEVTGEHETWFGELYIRLHRK